MPADKHQQTSMTIIVGDFNSTRIATYVDHVSENLVLFSCGIVQHM